MSSTKYTFIPVRFGKAGRVIHCGFEVTEEGATYYPILCGTINAGAKRRPAESGTAINCEKCLWIIGKGK